MTDDRTLERAARSWLEEGPKSAPDRPVEAALARIQTITQERNIRIPWRPSTMFDRLAVAAVSAVLVIGALTFGASLITTPDNAAGPCPTAFSEADAIDTFLPGLTQAQRAWGISGGSPGRVRNGLIAAFAWDTLNGPQSVITIEPTTGTRCRLLSFVENKPIRANLTRLDWSPSGDALALGIENPQDPEGNSSGQVLIWTPSRLVRVWSGPGQTPGLEWAPDGRSLAVWMSVGGGPTPARIIFADGSTDRVINVEPEGLGGLTWSPDGSRWLVGQHVGPDASTVGRTNSAVVDLADGSVIPIDLGIASLAPEGWIDDERVLLVEIEPGFGPMRHLDVPLGAPASYSVVPLPEAALNPLDQLIVFSPDRRRAAYSTEDGNREIVDLAGPPDSTPIHVDIGTAFAPGPAWAPDSSQLVYVTVLASSDAGSTYALWVVDADGTDPRQIATGGLWAMDDPWQPVPVR